MGPPHLGVALKQVCNAVEKARVACRAEGGVTEEDSDARGRAPGDSISGPGEASSAADAEAKPQGLDVLGSRHSRLQQSILHRQGSLSGLPLPPDK